MTRSYNIWVLLITSDSKPKSGYSFLNILYACGSIVTIFVTFFFLNVLIFLLAISCINNSFLILLAVSPEFASLFPYMANFNFVSFFIFVIALITCYLLLYYFTI